MSLSYIFIGGTPRGLTVFKALLNAFGLPKRLVVLKEDEHEINRWSETFIQLAETHGIPYRLRKRLKSEDEGWLQEPQDVLCGVVCGWRSILNAKLGEFMKYGLIAAHDSLLPAYRGFSPINWAIINHEKETGVSLFKLDDGDVDSGMLFGQLVTPIGPDDYAQDVYQRVTEDTVKLYMSFFEQALNGQVSFHEQDESLASYTCARRPEDGFIDWNKTDQEVYNLIRALAPPYPGASTVFEGKRYTIHRARLGPNRQKNYIGRIPGRVVSIQKDGVEVLAGTGSVLLEGWALSPTDAPYSPAQDIKSIRTQLS